MVVYKIGIKMNFQQFRIAYNSFLWLLGIIMALAIILWAKNSIQYFQETRLVDLVINMNSLERDFPKIWEMIKIWLIDTGWFALKIVIIKIIIFAVKSFPVKSLWLIHWDNLGEISPILGREIASHLRHNNSINFVTLLNLYKYSKNQMSLLIKHSRDQCVRQIFKKYDDHYEVDIENLNK